MPPYFYRTHTHTHTHRHAGSCIPSNCHCQTTYVTFCPVYSALLQSCVLCHLLLLVITSDVYNLLTQKYLTLWCLEREREREYTRQSDTWVFKKYLLWVDCMLCQIYPSLTLFKSVTDEVWNCIKHFFLTNICLVSMDHSYLRNQLAWRSLGGKCLSIGGALKKLNYKYLDRNVLQTLCVCMFCLSGC